MVHRERPGFLTVPPTQICYACLLPTYVCACQLAGRVRGFHRCRLAEKYSVHSSKRLCPSTFLAGIYLVWTHSNRCCELLVSHVCTSLHHWPEIEMSRMDTNMDPSSVKRLKDLGPWVLVLLGIATNNKSETFFWVIQTTCVRQSFFRLQYVILRP